MASYELPTDLIRKIQILTRSEAGLPNYDPDDPTLPALPSLSATVASLDPSPPYLRCKGCKGRLARGLQSFICVYCGRRQHQDGDVLPEPISFNSTVGYRWLLGSLDLDGSEKVALSVEKSDLNRGQKEPQKEVPLSDFLDLKIRWQTEPEKPDNYVRDEKPNFSGVDLHNFFSGSRKDIISGTPEVPPVMSRIETAGSNEVESEDDFNLFQNVEPSKLAVDALKVEKGGSLSGWEANFQSADNGNQYGNSTFDPFTDSKPNKDNNREGYKQFDPLLSSAVDLSAHIDSVFGSGKELNVESMKDHSTVSIETAERTSVDVWSELNSDVSQQSGQLDAATKAENAQRLDSDNPSTSVDNFQNNELQKNHIGAAFDQWNDFTSSIDAKDAQGPNDSDNPSTNVDWFLDSQWQKSQRDIPANEKTNEEENLFDGWNDFTSSTAVKNSQSLNSSENPSTSLDWFQDNQRQKNQMDVPDNRKTSEDENSFDEWSEFSNSVAVSIPSEKISTQDNTPIAVTHDITSEINLFSSNKMEGLASDTSAPLDFFSSSSNKGNASVEVNSNVPEGSASERATNASSNVGDNAKNDLNFLSTSTQPKEDVEMLFSQMHDLSFMLESSLSLPSKSDISAKD